MHVIDHASEAARYLKDNNEGTRVLVPEVQSQGITAGHITDAMRSELDTAGIQYQAEVVGEDFCKQYGIRAMRAVLFTSTRKDPDRYRESGSAGH